MVNKSCIEAKKVLYSKVSAHRYSIISSMRFEWDTKFALVCQIKMLNYNNSKFYSSSNNCSSEYDIEQLSHIWQVVGANKLNNG